MKTHIKGKFANKQMKVATLRNIQNMMKADASQAVCCCLAEAAFNTSHIQNQKKEQQVTCDHS